MPQTIPTLSDYPAIYEPLDWQLAPLYDLSPLLLLTGSAGGGKSRVAAEKIHAFCLRYPGTTALILRKTRESLSNSVVLFMNTEIIGGNAQVRHLETKHRWEYPNGSIIAYGGMKDEQQRENVRSVGQRGGVDIVWMEEAIQFTENDFNEMLGRMRGKAAGWRQIVLTTNPGPPSHWIYKRLIAGGEAAVYYSGALDNPHNPADYIVNLRRMTGLLRLRLVEGKWVQAEGAVYDEFSPDLHVLDRLPEGVVQYFAAMDWGFTNPGVLSVFGVDRDGRLYLVWEVYMTGKLVASPNPQEKGWWVERALEARRRFGVQWIDCDPSEPAYIETLRKAGLPARPAINDLRAGIDRVKARLRVQQDGRARLFILRGALSELDPALETRKEPTCTLDEFPAYSYPKGADGKAIKEEPIDLYNHGLDVVRYAVNRLDAPRGRIVQRL